jgi:hypothetical protein
MIDAIALTRPRAGVAHVTIALVWMAPAGHMEWPVKIPCPPLNPESR